MVLDEFGLAHFSPSLILNGSDNKHFFYVNNPNSNYKKYLLNYYNVIIVRMCDVTNNDITILQIVASKMKLNRV